MGIKQVVILPGLQIHVPGRGPYSADVAGMSGCLKAVCIFGLEMCLDAHARSNCELVTERGGVGDSAWIVSTRRPSGS